MFSAQKHLYNAEEYLDEEKKAIGEIGIGVDYGQKNPTVFEAFGIDYQRQVLRGLDEYYYSGRGEGKQKSPSEYAQDMKGFCENLEKEYNRVVSYIYIDPSAAGLIEEIRRVVPHIPVVPAQNDVKLGISRVQKLFSFMKILISSKQPMLIKELGLYQYDEKSIKRGIEIPVKENDHCCDGSRYLCMGMWNLIQYMLPPIERGDTN